jgi:glucan-binding YG repeat protein
MKWGIKMNTKIKRIIAVTLAISAFSIIEPTKHINLTSTVKVNAAVKGADLKGISLGDGIIDFKYSKTEYTLTLDSSVEKLAVRAKPNESEAEVRINGNQVYESNNYESEVNLDKGENTITIKVNNGSKNKTYTITVIRGKIEEEKQIYLSNITLSTGELNFAKETTSYNIGVKSDVDKVSIKAKPEDEDYDVEIDGVTVDNDNNYKKTVSLDKGNNEIKIRIEDKDDHEKIYILNINRGEINTTTNTSNTETSGNMSPNTTSIAKGWLLNNGQWYYLDENGNKQTSWKSVNGKWYYLDTNGIMKTGWQFVNNDWYYLDSNGVMETGWFKNRDGKWYYLYDSGTMAKNTTIGGFKIDSTGVWIK